MEPIESAAAAGHERLQQSPLGTALRLAGATSVGLLSLLLNPLFVAPVIAVAALVTARAGWQRDQAGMCGNSRGR